MGAACNWSDAFDVVIIGGGAAGIGVTASLLRRCPSLRIAIIEPSDRHYYQPAWSLVRELRGGKAIFTQPPMPIKCAGAPQKAMYLSCDEWLRAGRLNDIDVEFNTSAPVLFGVSAFVPPLMEYVKRYDADLVFNSNLVRVDGENRVAYFDVKHASGEVERMAKPFDMLHVAPPQVAPAFIAESALADAAGWCEVDHRTLQHPRYPNIFGLGDACSSPNAKTAAAVRKQIVVVAENVLAAREDREFKTFYDGYGSCPLTVERGKVILAEFGFGGKLLPTFKLDPTVPRFLAWLLKARLSPSRCWYSACIWSWPTQPLSLCLRSASRPRAERSSRGELER